MLRAILISAIWLNVGLLLGRLSGFFREALVAANFGISFEADVVVLMLTVPDLMVSLLMGGAMGAVLVPVFSSSPGNARMVLYQASLIFGLIFSLATLLMIWQAPVLVTMLVPGFDEPQIARASAALTLVLWLVPLTVLAGTTTAFLHTQNRFVMASLGTLMVNAAIIVGLYLVLLGQASIDTLAVFVIVGGLLRLSSQLAAIRPTLKPLSSWRPLLLDRPIFVRYGQAMLSGSLLFVFPVLGRAFASFEEVGSVAVLNYAMRLVELPMAVCISFLTVVLFPRLSQSFSDDPQLHRRYIRYGVQATLAMGLIASIMLILLADEYAAFVYGYGDMSALSVALVASLISIGLLVLPLQGLVIYNIAVFNSRNDTHTPMIINGVGLLAYLGLLKFEILGSGLVGIMWALVASFGLILMLQTFRLRVEQLRFAEIYLEKNYLAGSACGIALCTVWGYWISSWQQYSLIKLFLGFIGAIVCLLVIALFYADIRSTLKARIGARQ